MQLRRRRTQFSVMTANSGSTKNAHLSQIGTLATYVKIHPQAQGFSGHVRHVRQGKGKRREMWKQNLTG
jgi:hypothetical protein